MLDLSNASLYAVIHELEQTQWLKPDALQSRQFKQLDTLLAHAYATVPIYRRLWDDAGYNPTVPLTPEDWLRMPRLQRATAQVAGNDLYSQSCPAAHGSVNESQTSGSTGQPVKYLSTALTRKLWNAITLRHHTWHKHDFSARLCAIRAGHGNIVKGRRETSSWGPPVSTLHNTGNACLIDCRHDASDLLRWVAEFDPAYLLGLPSTIAAVAEHAIASSIQLPSLREINTYAEMLPPHLRTLCKQSWNADIADMYSCQEAGYIALQCPEHQHYHIQSESLLVEILNDANEPCRCGEIGRIVITTLHNFASPLIRYELMDFAEVGSACPCGRGLPVIQRIMGRIRNLITLPDGRSYWPVLYASAWSHIAPIRQLQLIQTTPQHFEVKVVMDRNLTPAEQTTMSIAISDSLGYPFTYTFTCQPHRIIGSNGKFESIISHVTPTSQSANAPSPLPSPYKK